MGLILDFILSSIVEFCICIIGEIVTKSKRVLYLVVPFNIALTVYLIYMREPIGEWIFLFLALNGSIALILLLAKLIIRLF